MAYPILITEEKIEGLSSDLEAALRDGRAEWHPWEDREVVNLIEAGPK